MSVTTVKWKAKGTFQKTKRVAASKTAVSVCRPRGSALTEYPDWRESTDIHQLELFLAVLDSPSMTRAAEKVFLSPGAVSLQLHKLTARRAVRAERETADSYASGATSGRTCQTLVKLTSQIKLESENDLTRDTRPFHFATGVTTLIYQLGRP
jgi:hypothetical protein